MSQRSSSTSPACATTPSGGAPSQPDSPASGARPEPCEPGIIPLSTQTFQRDVNPFTSGVLEQRSLSGLRNIRVGLHAAGAERGVVEEEVRGEHLERRRLHRPGLQQLLRHRCVVRARDSTTTTTTTTTTTARFLCGCVLLRWFGAHLRHDDGDIIRVETAVQPPAEVHATRASHLPPKSPNLSGKFQPKCRQKVP